MASNFIIEEDGQKMVEEIGVFTGHGCCCGADLIVSSSPCVIWVGRPVPGARWVGKNGLIEELNRTMEAVKVRFEA